MRIALLKQEDDVISLYKNLLRNTADDIIWTTGSGEQALVNIEQDRPDLLITPLHLTDMDCTRLSRIIIEQSPLPILLVSESIEKDSARVFEAMSQGVLDAFTRPDPGSPASIQAFLQKLDNVRKLQLADRNQRHRPVDEKPRRKPPLVAIGASTGGPAAIVKVLSALSPNPGAAIVIVQHMDQQFSAGMAKWLDDQLALPVHIATEGTTPLVDHVYLACTNDHLVLDAQQLFHYTEEPKDYPYRPSMDIFCETVLSHWPGPIVGVLLTGMGRDGANGLLSLKNRGMRTIVQDESSCAVFGMPRAAIALNAADEIHPVEDIGNAILQVINHEPDPA